MSQKLVVNPHYLVNNILRTIFFILACFNNIRSSVRALVNIFIMYFYFRTIFICKHVEFFSRFYLSHFFNDTLTHKKVSNRYRRRKMRTSYKQTFLVQLPMNFINIKRKLLFKSHLSLSIERYLSFYIFWLFDIL